jgi:phosphatidate cytidylyltransferase
MMFAGFLSIAFIIAVTEWQGVARKTRFPLAFLVIGICYMLISFLSMYWLRGLQPDGFKLALLTFLMVWVSDSMAYLVGKWLKGPKMAPAISPQKTLAGLFGAALGCILTLILAQALFHIFEVYNSWSDYVLLIGIAAVLGLVAQTGDLLISYVKRLAGVKDTGHLIPGHGGLLDRIDALMLVTPVFTLLATQFLL